MIEPRTILLDSEDRRAFAVRLIERIKIDPPIDITISTHVNRRSLAQNARLWKLHTLASEVTGYTPEEMHDIALCQHYGFTERQAKNPYTGEIENLKTPLKRSSQRDKKEFRKFLDFVEDFYVCNLGVFLGEPNEAFDQLERV